MVRNLIWKIDRKNVGFCEKKDGFREIRFQIRFVFVLISSCKKIGFGNRIANRISWKPNLAEGFDLVFGMKIGFPGSQTWPKIGFQIGLQIGFPGGHFFSNRIFKYKAIRLHSGMLPADCSDQL